MSEPRGERGSRKGEIDAARERGIAWWEGHRETYNEPLIHGWRKDAEAKTDVSSSETGGTESLKRGGDKEFSSRGKKIENTLTNYFYSLRNAELGQGMRKKIRGESETLHQDAQCL